MKTAIAIAAAMLFLLAACSTSETVKEPHPLMGQKIPETAAAQPDCDTNQEAVDMGGTLGWQCVSSAPSSTVSYTPITTTPTTTAASVVSGRCNRLADTVDKTFRDSGLPMSSIEIYPSSDCVISGYTKACFQGRCYSPYEACPQIEAGLRRGMYSIVSEHAVDAPIAIAEEPDKCLVILFL